MTHRARDSRDEFARWTTVLAAVALTLAYFTVRSGASSALLVRMLLFVSGFLIGAALVRLAARLAVRYLGRPEPAELASALMGGAAAGLLPSLLPRTWTFVGETDATRLWAFFVAGVLLALVVVPLRRLFFRWQRAATDGTTVAPVHTSGEERGDEDGDFDAD
ncbi:MAG: hypothetical protein M3Q60_11115 [Actinomycetota bacterium]|nr:hypothetical protein [Actinomycetota bacterium]